MHSSTSSFDASVGWARSGTARATVLLLVGIAVLCAVVEFGTRLVVSDMSNTLRRVRDESKAARMITPTAGDTRQLLIVGNSLLLAGVDVDQLNESLQPAWHGVRFGLEQTTYYDWHYGLKRLIADGARPSAIVVGFEPRHLVGSSVRTEQFAYYLMRKRDALDVSRDLDLNPSGTAELFFSNVSAFWALRKEIRKNVLGRLMPELPDLMRLVTRGGGWPSPSIDEVVKVGGPRLQAMRDTADTVGARLVLVMMPPVSSEYTWALQALGREVGVPILTPLTDQDLTPGDYESDKYHLDVEGRRRYTEALAPQLLQALQ